MTALITNQTPLTKAIAILGTILLPHKIAAAPPVIKEKPRLPVLEDFPLISAEKLRFSDTDQQGHISNPVFAMCFQNARMELLYNSNRIPLPEDAMFAIVKLTIEFRGQMFWPCKAEVGTKIERVGRSSVALEQGLFANGKCVATAESVVALVNKKTGKSMPIPEETAAALRSPLRLQ